MWKKEVARDLLALGSIPFYILVMARSLTGQYYQFTYQLLISIIIISLTQLVIKNYNKHLARTIVIIAFTIIFYNQLIYAIFAITAGIAVIISLIYLKIKNKEIILGTLIGIITSIIAYYLTQLI
jgi:hypothetical protein